MKITILFLLQKKRIRQELHSDGVLVDKADHPIIVWIDLGFNDLTEGHGTLQGGTNEHVIKKLYKKLKKEKDGAERFLEVFWYTAKGLFQVIYTKYI